VHGALSPSTRRHDQPGQRKSLAGAEALDSADAIVMLSRFRNWPTSR
jgi:hypothetical protein